MGTIKLTSLNQKLQEFLKNKSENNPNFNIEKFLNPSLDDLHDPLLLSGMKEAKERVEKAIQNNERVLIYGDYDCDGIVASTVLFLFLSSKGLSPDVYIPNRFDDGYGLSVATINEIQSRFNPDLIITVDLGITAIRETEEIKSRGIDIVITDHHEMGDDLPKTIVVDPKIPNQKYPFSGLCGAGVALKLVQALGGISEVKKYIDLVSIATIGDIVPLVDENRAIAKLGLDLINSGNARRSIMFMLETLGLSKINSTDVAFKIVPRVNASGRMAEGKIVFDYFAENDDSKLSELLAKIEADNAERLAEIQKGNAEIEKEIKKLKFQNQPILILTGDFHQGVLGILSSRICHDLGRPTICFAKTDYGTLKGSGRSVDGVDLHALVLELSHLCVRCGGHKMAIGLEIEEKNFEEFKKKIAEKMSEKYDNGNFIQNFDYSFEIEDKDINKKFIDELSILEPFGCENEKPIFMIRVHELSPQQMPGKSFRHYKFVTKNGKHIVAFGAGKYVSALSQSGEKQIIVDLEINEYKGKFYPQAIFKTANLVDFKFEETRQENMISSLMSLFLSNKTQFKPQNITEFNKRDVVSVIKNNTTSAFAHAVVIDNSFDYGFINDIKNLGFVMSPAPLANKQNVVIVRPEGAFLPDELAGYEKVFYLRRCFEREHVSIAENMTSVFEPEYITKLSAKINTKREVLGLCFVNIKNNLDIFAVSAFEWAKKLSAISKNLSPAELVFALLVFAELEIFNILFDGGEFKVEKGKCFDQKQELSNSKLFREVERVLPKN
ncbi:MAG: single-stranded-DNA-specific exonuclease RecJ [Clostridia bacterium]|nr:single-stranded-DNA-specific exonuclease RecJ [Clostridia bacterium]